MRKYDLSSNLYVRYCRAISTAAGCPIMCLPPIPLVVENTRCISALSSATKKERLLRASTTSESKPATHGTPCLWKWQSTTLASALPETISISILSPVAPRDQSVRRFNTSDQFTGCYLSLLCSTDRLRERTQNINDVGTDNFQNSKG